MKKCLIVIVVLIVIMMLAVFPGCRAAGTERPDAAETTVEETKKADSEPVVTEEVDKGEPVQDVEDDEDIAGEKEAPSEEEPQAEEEVSNDEEAIKNTVLGFIEAVRTDEE